MKRVIALFGTVILGLLFVATPALAAVLSISPPSVEFDVPADGSTDIEFLVYDFTGDLEIRLEDIPLRVEPEMVSVAAREEGTRVVLTFYGDDSLGSQVFTGKIRFLAMTGGTVAMGIKVKATVNHIATGPVEAPPAPPGPPPGPPPAATSGTTEWPIIPVAGFAAGTAIVITIIVMVARRKRY